MPAECLDSCLYPDHVQEERVKSARVLSDLDIKCLVWGEDALAFIHFVPTLLLLLIVRDKDVQTASTAIIQALQYESVTGFNAVCTEYSFKEGEPAMPHTLALSAFSRLPLHRVLLL
ncbi:hypothetical protein DXG03_004745 [Asterophora parasitica]|uniref:Uncharacterized protein n=1 Tax=Asterophora parasitica TaxID=117018 RepID=A0A9P7G9G2_9AGAR|nr:hypothetical protein DXG03_004745 [Asterophora parasitica]